MVASLPQHLPSPRVLDELQTNYLRIKSPVSAMRLWERVLTESDRRTLGWDSEAAWKLYGTVGMWKKLRGVSTARAVVEVAHKLNFIDEGTQRWLLYELGEAPDDPETAIASDALVLVERPKTAYWQGQEIEVDWDRYGVLWTFMWELGCHAKSGQPVDRLTFGEHAHQDVVAKQKSRLLNEPSFPADLGDRIVSVGIGTQRLDLSPEKIRIFVGGIGEQLREWIPSRP